MGTVSTAQRCYLEIFACSAFTQSLQKQKRELFFNPMQILYRRTAWCRAQVRKEINAHVSLGSYIENK